MRRLAACWLALAIFAAHADSPRADRGQGGEAVAPPQATATAVAAAELADVLPAPASFADADIAPLAADEERFARRLLRRLNGATESVWGNQALAKFARAGVSDSRVDVQAGLDAYKVSAADALFRAAADTAVEQARSAAEDTFIKSIDIGYDSGLSGEWRLSADVLAAFWEGESSLLYGQLGGALEDGYPTGNFGLGVRVRPLRTVMAGVGVFIDHLEDDRPESKLPGSFSRYSYGAELRTPPFDLSANLYQRITAPRRIEDEETGELFDLYTAEGWDAEAAMMAGGVEIAARRYVWEQLRDEDIVGWEYRVAYSPWAWGQVEVAYDHPEDGDNKVAVRLNFSHLFGAQENESSGMFARRREAARDLDVWKRRYERVRRSYQQRIIKEEVAAVPKPLPIPADPAEGDRIPLPISLPRPAPVAFEVTVALVGATGAQDGGRDFYFVADNCENIADEAEAQRADECVIGVAAGDESLTVLIDIVREASVDGEELEPAEELVFGFDASADAPFDFSGLRFTVAIPADEGLTYGVGFADDSLVALEGGEPVSLTVTLSVPVASAAAAFGVTVVFVDDAGEVQATSADFDFVGAGDGGDCAAAGDECVLAFANGESAKTVAITVTSTDDARRTGAVSFGEPLPLSVVLVSPATASIVIPTADEALFEAVGAGDDHLLESLLDALGDEADDAVNEPNADGDYALILAVESGRADIVALLAAVDGIDANVKKADGDSALHLAAAAGDAAIVEALAGIDGIDANLKNDDDDTPLHLAAADGHSEVVDELVDVPGILVNAENDDGDTPLHLAAADGHSEVVEELVDVSGILVNAENDDGDTPLHLAAADGHSEVVEELVDVPEILVNAANDAGDTPLHLAAAGGDVDTLTHLLEADGIDVNVPDDDGNTPLDLANRGGHDDIADDLNEADARCQNDCEGDDIPLGSQTVAFESNGARITEGGVVAVGLFVAASEIATEAATVTLVQGRGTTTSTADWEFVGVNCEADSAADQCKIIIPAADADVEQRLEALVRAVDDDEAEEEERLVLALAVPPDSELQVGDDFTLGIVDNDVDAAARAAVGAVIFDPARADVAEGDNMEIVIRLPAPASAGGVSVTLAGGFEVSFDDSDDPDGAVYLAESSDWAFNAGCDSDPGLDEDGIGRRACVVSFAEGADLATVTVGVEQDSTYEGEERAAFNFLGSPPEGLVFPRAGESFVAVIESSDYPTLAACAAAPGGAGTPRVIEADSGGSTNWNNTDRAVTQFRLCGLDAGYYQLIWSGNPAQIGGTQMRVSKTGLEGGPFDCALNLADGDSRFVCDGGAYLQVNAGEELWLWFVGDVLPPVDALILGVDRVGGNTPATEDDIPPLAGFAAPREGFATEGGFVDVVFTLSIESAVSLSFDANGRPYQEAFGGTVYSGELAARIVPSGGSADLNDWRFGIAGCDQFTESSDYQTPTVHDCPLRVGDPFQVAGGVMRDLPDLTALTVRVHLQEDDIVEGGETLVLQLVPDSQNFAYQPDERRFTIHIAQSEILHDAEYDPATQAAAEGRQAVFTLRLDPPLAAAAMLTVIAPIAAEGAIAATPDDWDYAAGVCAPRPASTLENCESVFLAGVCEQAVEATECALDLPAGASEALVTLDIVDDGAAELAESLLFGLIAPDNIRGGLASARVTIAASDLDAIDPETGLTRLLTAVKTLDEVGVSLWVEAGADPNVVAQAPTSPFAPENFEGNTALDIANVVAFGHPTAARIVAYLKTNDGRCNQTCNVDPDADTLDGRLSFLAFSEAAAEGAPDGGDRVTMRIAVDDPFATPPPPLPGLPLPGDPSLPDNGLTTPDFPPRTAPLVVTVGFDAERSTAAASDWAYVAGGGCSSIMDDGRCVVIIPADASVAEVVIAVALDSENEADVEMAVFSFVGESPAGFPLARGVAGSFRLDILPEAPFMFGFAGDPIVCRDPGGAVVECAASERNAVLVETAEGAVVAVMVTLDRAAPRALSVAVRGDTGSFQAGEWSFASGCAEIDGAHCIVGFAEGARAAEFAINITNDDRYEPARLARFAVPSAGAAEGVNDGLIVEIAESDRQIRFVKRASEPAIEGFRVTIDIVAEPGDAEAITVTVSSSDNTDDWTFADDCETGSNPLSGVNSDPDRCEVVIPPNPQMLHGEPTGAQLPSTVSFIVYLEDDISEEIAERVNFGFEDSAPDGYAFGGDFTLRIRYSDPFFGRALGLLDIVPGSVTEDVGHVAVTVTVAGSVDFGSVFGFPFTVTVAELNGASNQYYFSDGCEVNGGERCGVVFAARQQQRVISVGVDDPFEETDENTELLFSIDNASIPYEFSHIRDVFLTVTGDSDALTRSVGLRATRFAPRTEDSTHPVVLQRSAVGGGDVMVTLEFVAEASSDSVVAPVAGGICGSDERDFEYSINSITQRVLYSGQEVIYPVPPRREDWPVGAIPGSRLINHCSSADSACEMVLPSDELDNSLADAFITTCADGVPELAETLVFQINGEIPDGFAFDPAGRRLTIILPPSDVNVPPAQTPAGEANDGGFSALALALTDNNFAEAQAWLNAGADPQISGAVCDRNALAVLAENYDGSDPAVLDLIGLMVLAGGDINQVKNCQGRIPGLGVQVSQIGVVVHPLDIIADRDAGEFAGGENDRNALIAELIRWGAKRPADAAQAIISLPLIRYDGGDHAGGRVEIGEGESAELRVEFAARSGTARVTLAAQPGSSAAAADWEFTDSADCVAQSPLNSAECVIEFVDGGSGGMVDVSFAIAADSAAELDETLWLGFAGAAPAGYQFGESGAAREAQAVVIAANDAAVGLNAAAADVEEADAAAAEAEAAAKAALRAAAARIAVNERDIAAQAVGSAADAEVVMESAIRALTEAAAAADAAAVAAADADAAADAADAATAAINFIADADDIFGVVDFAIDFEPAAIRVRTFATAAAAVAANALAAASVIPFDDGGNVVPDDMTIPEVEIPSILEDATAVANQVAWAARTARTAVEIAQRAVRESDESVGTFIGTAARNDYGRKISVIPVLSAAADDADRAARAVDSAVALLSAETIAGLQAEIDTAVTATEAAVAVWYSAIAADAPEDERMAAFDAFQEALKDLANVRNRVTPFSSGVADAVLGAVEAAEVVAAVADGVIAQANGQAKGFAAAAVGLVDDALAKARVAAAEQDEAAAAREAAAAANRAADAASRAVGDSESAAAAAAAARFANAAAIAAVSPLAEAAFLAGTDAEYIASDGYLTSALGLIGLYLTGSGSTHGSNRDLHALKSLDTLRNTLGFDLLFYYIGDSKLRAVEVAEFTKSAADEAAAVAARAVAAAVPNRAAVAARAVAAAEVAAAAIRELKAAIAAADRASEAAAAANPDSPDYSTAEGEVVAVSEAAEAAFEAASAAADAIAAIAAQDRFSPAVTAEIRTFSAKFAEWLSIILFVGSEPADAVALPAEVERYIAARDNYDEALDVYSIFNEVVSDGDVERKAAALATLEAATAALEAAMASLVEFTKSAEANGVAMAAAKGAEAAEAAAAAREVTEEVRAAAAEIAANNTQEVAAVVSAYAAAETAFADYLAAADNIAATEAAALEAAANAINAAAADAAREAARIAVAAADAVAAAESAADAAATADVAYQAAKAAEAAAKAAAEADAAAEAAADAALSNADHRSAVADYETKHQAHRTAAAAAAADPADPDLKAAAVAAFKAAEAAREAAYGPNTLGGRVVEAESAAQAAAQAAAEAAAEAEAAALDAAVAPTQLRIFTAQVAADAAAEAAAAAKVAADAAAAVQTAVESATSKWLALDGDPDAIDGEGKTALHHLAAAGATDLIRELIAAGADINAADTAGYTPLDRAREAEADEAAIALLERHDARCAMVCDGGAQNRIGFASARYDGEEGTVFAVAITVLAPSSYSFPITIAADSGLFADGDAIIDSRDCAVSPGPAPFSARAFATDGDDAYRYYDIEVLAAIEGNLLAQSGCVVTVPRGADSVTFRIRLDDDDATEADGQEWPLFFVGAAPAGFDGYSRRRAVVVEAASDVAVLPAAAAAREAAALAEAANEAAAALVTAARSAAELIEDAEAFIPDAEAAARSVADREIADTTLPPVAELFSAAVSPLLEFTDVAVAAEAAAREAGETGTANSLAGDLEFFGHEVTVLVVEEVEKALNQDLTAEDRLDAIEEIMLAVGVFKGHTRLNRIVNAILDSAVLFDAFEADVTPKAEAWKAAADAAAAAWYGTFDRDRNNNLDSDILVTDPIVRLEFLVEATRSADNAAQRAADAAAAALAAAHIAAIADAAPAGALAAAESAVEASRAVGRAVAHTAKLFSAYNLLLLTLSEETPAEYAANIRTAAAATAAAAEAAAQAVETAEEIAAVARQAAETAAAAEAAKAVANAN